MKTCILAVIKDEQEYLDDFIKYHLGIGIDTIFLYEDVGSMPHQPIVDKYENVILNSVCELLPIEKIRELKEKGRDYQPLYVINALMYIKENYDYDWCFSIDCDEFITPTDPFPDLLNDYVNHDAIMLHWKNFGYSGHIEKPKYDKPIWEIYDKPCYYFKDDLLHCNCTKMCFNMKRFERKFVNVGCCLHVALCNYVRPDFTWDRGRPCFDRIYIRHYITKSFEEYIWKLTKRGITYKGHRTIDDFFYIHPELRDKKEEIIELYNSKKGEK